MTGEHHNPVVSTGRGGQGNIGRDPTTYVDGAIVREGAQGQSADGDYSSGRGGAGNIVASPRVGPTGRRGSQDVIPDAALVDHKGHENFHIGRGGEGNVHKEKEKAPGKPKEGLGDKLKGILLPNHDK